jgi:hypothetical protein
MSRDSIGRRRWLHAHPEAQTVTAPGDVGTARRELEPITDFAPPTRLENLERIAELSHTIAGGLLEDLKLAAELVRALDADHDAHGGGVYGGPRTWAAMRALRAALAVRGLADPETGEIKP